MEFSFDGKVAIVTGASRGLGKGIAVELANSGAAVALASRTQESLDDVAADIEDAGGQALPIATHVGEHDDIAHLVERTVEEFGGIDILVNNAGTNPHFGPLLGAEESMWAKTFDVNVVGYWRLCQAVVPYMRERGGGKIVNMASIAGQRPAPRMGIYGVTKAGVIMLTEVLALELASDNIQVNALAPGFIRTRFSKIIWNTPGIAEPFEDATPAHRFGEVEDVLGAALYLASSHADYVTGETITIDGGLSIGWPMTE